MTYSHNNRNDLSINLHDNHLDNTNAKRLDQPDNHTCKPVNQDEDLHQNEDEAESVIFKALEESLPAIFTPQTASKAIGGFISPSTFRKLDSLGEGPPNIKSCSKISYERQSFLAWFKTQLKIIKTT